MDAVNPREVFSFGEFRLARQGGDLVRCPPGSEPVPIHLGSRAIEVLQLLVERQGKLVSKDEIMAIVWPTAVVEESNLFVQISALRRALDGGRQGPSTIQTVAGRGYRFVPAVTRSEQGEICAFGVESRREHLPSEQAEPAARAKRPVPVGSLSVTGAGAIPLLAFLIGIVLTAVIVVGKGPIVDRFTPAGLTRRPVPYSPQDRRLSVIVLPFETGGDDPAQQSLAINLMRNVMNVIAQDRTVPFVPAITASAYRGKAGDLRALGRNYDLHFAVTGDARQQDGRLIVTAGVFEIAGVPSPIWSQRFERPDTEGGWREITGAIGNHFLYAAIEAEVARAAREHPDDLDKRDLLLAALAKGANTRENYLRAFALAERSLAIDPNYLQAILEYADEHVGMVLDGLSNDQDADLAIAEKYADRAVQLAPNNYAALRIKGKILRARGEWEGAAAIIRDLLERNPFDPYRQRELGIVQMMQGRPKDALESFRLAKEEGIGAEAVPLVDSNIAQALLEDGRFDEALAQAHLAIAECPPGAGPLQELSRLVLIAAEAANGHDEQIRTELKTFLFEKRTYANVAALKRHGYTAGPRLIRL